MTAIMRQSGQAATNRAQLDSQRRASQVKLQKLQETQKKIALQRKSAAQKQQRQQEVKALRQKRLAMFKSCTGPGCKTCSFHGDTHVLTADGYKAIRSLTPGKDRVWARSEHTGEMDWRPISAHYSNVYDETLRITVRDQRSGATHTIVSNRIHPFFVPTSESEQDVQVASNDTDFVAEVLPSAAGDWVEAQALMAGDLLFNADGTFSVVDSAVLFDDALLAFNLTVEDFHTYFVKADQESDAPAIWVHNDCFTERKVLSTLGLGKNGKNHFHRNIKPQILKQFSQDLSKKGVRNPNIGEDKNGNIIFQDPRNKSIILRTTTKLSTFGE